MIIDCKAIVRRPLCDFSTSFVRLVRPQNDNGVLTATSLRPYGVNCDPSTTLAFLLRPQYVVRTQYERGKVCEGRIKNAVRTRRTP
ncbi:hypothetical protein DPMN_119136 [Dreissena polymorpha]|uniref:Uncharacterized protein n=1 Tax=Dreissena polymorpha TaxID=45954 RepID=A0A9D4JRQ5_DREPO|nr:hypothetical protein DPMN_119136 [Dreissena polymorpha]